MEATEYDVVIVGGSLAGCTAATLYGRAGLRVALIEKHADTRAYKVACSHFIQASAVPTLQRRGLSGRIEAEGGVPNHIDFWSRYGHTATELEWAGGRVSGVRVRDRAGGERSISARLVVAADGRGSRVAGMAGIRTRTRPHERIYWFAYYRGIELDADVSSQMWFAEPDVALALHNEDGLTELVYMTPKKRRAEWKADPAQSLRRAFAALPRAPRLDRAEMVGRPIGKVDHDQRAPPRRREGHGPDRRRRPGLRPALGHRLRLGPPVGGVAGGRDRRAAAARRPSGRGAAALSAHAPAPAGRARLPDIRLLPRAAHEPDRAAHVRGGGARPAHRGALRRLRQPMDRRRPLSRPEARGTGGVGPRYSAQRSHHQAGWPP
jgi:hypothetical protein